MKLWGYHITLDDIVRRHWWQTCPCISNSFCRGCNKWSDLIDPPTAGIMLLPNTITLLYGHMNLTSPSFHHSSKTEVCPYSHPKTWRTNCFLNHCTTSNSQRCVPHCKEHPSCLYVLGLGLKYQHNLESCKHSHFWLEVTTLPFIPHYNHHYWLHRQWEHKHKESCKFIDQRIHRPHWQPWSVHYRIECNLRWRLSEVAIKLRCLFPKRQPKTRARISGKCISSNHYPFWSQQYRWQTLSRLRDRLQGEFQVWCIDWRWALTEWTRK